MDKYNILPVNDIKEHIESEDCECEPVVEIVENQVIIKHNAWDLRDLKEQGLIDNDLDVILIDNE